MATREQHLLEAARNEVLAGKLADMGEMAWAVTVLFYASVHLVQAYLTSRSAAPSTHAARDVAIERDAALRPILRHYDILKKASEIARYDCRPFVADDFQEAQFRYMRLQGHMQRLVS
jgi:hypothetical protein